MSAPVVIPYIGLAHPSVLNATMVMRISTFLSCYSQIIQPWVTMWEHIHSPLGPKVMRVTDNMTREFRMAWWYSLVESHSEITVSHHTVKVTTTHLHAHTLCYHLTLTLLLYTVQILCHIMQRTEKWLLVLYPPLQVSSTLTLINIVLYPPLQSPCVLCDSRAIYSSHSNTSIARILTITTRLLWQQGQIVGYLDC